MGFIWRCYKNADDRQSDQVRLLELGVLSEGVMGNMMLRGIDEGSRALLDEQAAERGIAPEELALEIIEREIYRLSGRRGERAERIIAKQIGVSQTDSVQIIRELRDGA